MIAKRFSIPTLYGEEAEKFIEFDSQESTHEDIENQEEAKERYLQQFFFGMFTSTNTFS